MENNMEASPETEHRITTQSGNSRSSYVIKGNEVGMLRRYPYLTHKANLQNLPTNFLEKNVMWVHYRAPFSN